MALNKNTTYGNYRENITMVGCCRRLQYGVDRLAKRRRCKQIPRVGVHASNDEAGSAIWVVPIPLANANPSGVDGLTAGAHQTLTYWCMLLPLRLKHVFQFRPPCVVRLPWVHNNSKHVIPCNIELTNIFLPTVLYLLLILCCSRWR